MTKPFGKTPGPAKRHRRCNMGSQVRQSLEVKQLNCGDCRRRIQGPLPSVSEKEHGKLSRREQAESNRQAVNRQAANGSVWLRFERRSTGLLRKRWFSEAIRGPEFSRRSTGLQRNDDFRAGSGVADTWHRFRCRPVLVPQVQVPFSRPKSIVFAADRCSVAKFRSKRLQT